MLLVAGPDGCTVIMMGIATDCLSCLRCTQQMDSRRVEALTHWQEQWKGRMRVRLR